MPLQTQHPTITESGEFPFLGLQLAISPKWSDDPLSIGAQVAARFIPFRVTEAGTVERLEDQPRHFVAVDMFQLAAESPALAEAVTKIMEGLQAIITEKGV